MWVGGELRRKRVTPGPSTINQVGVTCTPGRIQQSLGRHVFPPRKGVRVWARGELRPRGGNSRTEHYQSSGSYMYTEPD